MGWSYAAGSLPAAQTIRRKVDFPSSPPHQCHAFVFHLAVYSMDICYLPLSMYNNNTAHVKKQQNLRSVDE